MRRSLGVSTRQVRDGVSDALEAFLERRGDLVTSLLQEAAQDAFRSFLEEHPFSVVEPLLDSLRQTFRDWLDELEEPLRAALPSGSRSQLAPIEEEDAAPSA
ncbi:MAG TPA: hypothetical protein VKY90_10510 [Candidatus Dormibacteraeota bacterium]|nr:hypothetical protein [Candidatus Dormibacteraeota bacterium]